MQEIKTLLHDRYLIVHIEHTSNFSKVFFALDTYQKPPRNCIVKAFEPIVREPKVREWIEPQFLQEAKRLKQLSLVERNLPEVYTYVSDSEACYLVCELIEGENLQQLVLNRGKFSTQEVREILSKLLLVLKHLHQGKIIHQNIKPKNIILRKSDRLPMLTNFGSIKQIMTTYGFYGDKNMFSTNNTYGYIAPEQALGRSVPVSDLYSLGFTAIYLLTAKNPIDLPINADSGKIKLPKSIFEQDLDLANILTIATSPNVKDRYSSATEMLNNLRSSKSNFSFSQLHPSRTAFTAFTALRKDNLEHRDWWKLAIYLITILYILSTEIIAWYDWNFSQKPPVISLPEPTFTLPASPPSKQPQTAAKKSSTTRPSMLNSRSKEPIEIPIVATGTPKEKLRQILGEPNAIQPGYWQNSSAWIYKSRANNTIDLGYLFDLDTGKLRQTEVAIAPAVGLVTIEEILASLLQGKITPKVSQELAKIYSQQATEYSFELDNLEGNIQREADNHIYLSVWEADFP